MKKEKDAEIKEETSKIFEKPKKKGKIKLFIILGIILAVIIAVCIYIIPKIKDEGLQGVLNPTNLPKEDQKNYDLYLKAIDKYKNLKNDDENFYEYRIIYLEGVDEPILVLRHDINKEYVRRPREEVTLFYIKDGKVIEKKYEENSNIKPYYNVEKDEIDYYLYQIEDAQTVNSKMTVTLLKDIVTECSDPYIVKLTEDDYFTAISNKGVKTSIQKIYHVFIENLESTFNTEKRIIHEISIGDGYKGVKHQLKKAIKNKYYLKDIVTDATWEKIDDILSEYTLKRGQKILDSSEVSGGSCSNAIKGTDPEEETPTPDTNIPEPDKKNPSPGKTTPDPEKGIEPSKPTTKCNDGFVYVSDDDRCYNSNKTKSPSQKSCDSGYTSFGPDCGKVVDSSYCESGNDQYGMMDGKCVDNSTLYNNFPLCPSGYEYLWGSYGGQEFNGACYKWEKPNF